MDNELDEEEFERLLARLAQMSLIQLLRLQCKIDLLADTSGLEKDPMHEADTVVRDLFKKGE